MFKKLLSNLPFNPSLIGQVAFYAKRMRQETALRRSGMIFLVLAILVQVFAVASPPEPTLAESSNDILRGGFSTQADAVSKCRSNTQGFATILAYYKLSCDSLAAGSTKNYRSTDFDKRLDSMGRNPQGQTIQRTGKPTEEYSVVIGGTTFYMRNLWAWDSGAYSTYKMLEVKNSDGVTFLILYNCGNLVSIGRYTPPPPPPPPPTPTPPPSQPPNQPPPPPDACPYKPGYQTSTSQCDVCPNRPGTQLTTNECDVCPNIPGEQSNENECYPCPEARNDDSATACMEFDKTARNQTQNLANANNTTAKASDEIHYTLSVKNTGKTTVKAFVVEENVADILEYASLTDLGGGELQDKRLIVWPAQDINPGQTITKRIAIKVKDTIPQTPSSVSDPGSFDLTMTNVFYGKSINIKLPPNVVKRTEQVTQTLPNTGPGTSLIVGFSIVVVAAYFLARSKLFATELGIVRDDYITGRLDA